MTDRCATCDKPMLSNAHEWDHPFRPAPTQPTDEALRALVEAAENLARASETPLHDGHQYAPVLHEAWHAIDTARSALAATDAASPGVQRCGCWSRVALPPYEHLPGCPTMPQVHVNTGTGEALAMAWSEGHTAGYEEGLAGGLEDAARHIGLMGEDGETPTKVERGRTWVLLDEVVKLVERRATDRRVARFLRTAAATDQPTPPAPDPSPSSALRDTVVAKYVTHTDWCLTDDGITDCNCLVTERRDRLTTAIDAIVAAARAEGLDGLVDLHAALLVAHMGFPGGRHARCGFCDLLPPPATDMDLMERGRALLAARARRTGEGS